MGVTDSVRQDGKEIYGAYDEFCASGGWSSFPLTRDEEAGHAQHAFFNFAELSPADALGALLQLLGAGCLVLVALTHFCEELHVFP